MRLVRIPAGKKQQLQLAGCTHAQLRQCCGCCQLLERMRLTTLIGAACHSCWHTESHTFQRTALRCTALQGSCQLIGKHCQVPCLAQLLTTHVPGIALDAAVLLPSFLVKDLQHKVASGSCTAAMGALAPCCCCCSVVSEAAGGRTLVV